MQDILDEYFIGPILGRTGYNPINTMVYAAIALLALYIIWRFMKNRKFDFSGSEFLYGVSAFVLFGSTVRVLTDISDSGMMGAMAKSGGLLGQLYSSLAATGMLDYSFITVSPGIYIVTATLFLFSLAMGHVLKSKRFALYAGLALFAPCFLLLIPFMQHFLFFILSIVLAIVASYLAFFILKKFMKIECGIHDKLAIAGQSLDGAATFVIIDLFSNLTGKSYFEQHVLSAGIGELTPLGYFLFFFVKAGLATSIVYFLSKEDIGARDKAFILIAVAIMGFAPGIRDILRMLVGS